MPQPQRGGIALPEGLSPLKHKAGLGRLFLQNGFGEQHATRENIALDEIHARAISLIIGFRNRDALNGGNAAGFQPVIEGSEIDRPMGLAHCLDHFNGGNAVKAAPGVAVVLEVKTGAAVESGLGDAFLGIGQLFA